jgi:hypothetical protein
MLQAMMLGLVQRTAFAGYVESVRLLLSAASFGLMLREE